MMDGYGDHMLAENDRWDEVCHLEYQEYLDDLELREQFGILNNTDPDDYYRGDNDD